MTSCLMYYNIIWVFDGMKRKKLIIAIIVLIIVAVGAFLIFGHNGAIPVEQVTPQNRIVKRTIAANGTVKSLRSADMGFSLSGQISEISVEEGDEVEKGALLARIDNSSLWNDVQAAKDARDVALRDRELYIENYATNPDAVGGTDEYNIGLRRQNELVSRSEDQYQGALSALNKTYLYAPFAGTVIDVISIEGEVAGLGSPVVKLADLNQLIFEITVDQEDFGLLEKGMPVEITLDAYDGDTFEGTVLALPYYSQTTDSGGSDFTVTITIGNSPKPVLYGMNGEAHIVLQNSSNEVQSLIFDSIFTDDSGNSYVWVLENGTVHRNDVETGIEGDVYTEVVTPLEGKTIVILVSQDSELQEGQKAKVTRGNATQ